MWLYHHIVQKFICKYLIYYFTKLQADIFHTLQLAYAHFETIKNQLIYNLNTVYTIKLVVQNGATWGSQKKKIKKIFYDKKTFKLIKKFLNFFIFQ